MKIVEINEDKNIYYKEVTCKVCNTKFILTGLFKEINGLGDIPASHLHTENCPTCGKQFWSKFRFSEMQVLTKRKMRRLQRTGHINRTHK